MTILFAMTGSISAQTYQRRASLGINQVAGQGRCVVEVVVDGIADVAIRGDSGTLRNLSGQQPQWRRFECTGIMPSNPANFQFRGVDGRGRQQLIQDPRNSGAAVIRIEDSQGGAEAYTFDVTWSGGSGYNEPYYPNTSYPNTSRNSGIIGGQYAYNDAVRACQDGVRQRYNVNSIVFDTVNVGDYRGPRDRVEGVFRTGRGDRHSYSCTVNTNNGRLLAVQIDQNGNAPAVYGDRYGDRRNGAMSDAQGMRACEQSVANRVRNNGNGSSVRFGNTNIRNDRIFGTVQVDRYNRTESFNFACSMDLYNGTVQSVDLNRR